MTCSNICVNRVGDIRVKGKCAVLKMSRAPMNCSSLWIKPHRCSDVVYV